MATTIQITEIDSGEVVYSGDAWAFCLDARDNLDADEIDQLCNLKPGGTMTLGGDSLPPVRVECFDL